MPAYVVNFPIKSGGTVCPTRNPMNCSWEIGLTCFPLMLVRNDGGHNRRQHSANTVA